MENMEYEEDMEPDINPVSQRRSGLIGSKKISPEIMFELESNDDFQDYDETLQMEDERYNQ
jgi:hypothetical protein